MLLLIVREGDRLGNGIAILLTITAYSLVIADVLPALGYLTLMDNCILGRFNLELLKLHAHTIIS